MPPVLFLGSVCGRVGRVEELHHEQTLQFAYSHNKIFRTKCHKSVHDITSFATLILNRRSFSCSSLVASFAECAVGRQPRTAMKNLDSKGTVTHFPTSLSRSLALWSVSPCPILSHCANSDVIHRVEGHKQASSRRRVPCITPLIQELENHRVSMAY